MQQCENKEKKSAFHWAHFPRTHVLTAGYLGLALSVILIFFPSNTVEAKKHQAISIDLPLHSDSTTEDANQELVETTPIAEKITWQTESVRNGDNLSLIFQRAGLSDQQLYRFMHACEEAKTLKRIHPGHTLAFDISSDGELEQLRYQFNQLESLIFKRNDEGYSATKEVLHPDVQLAYREATITSSLFLAGQEAKMDANLTMELATIFGWDIDFALDIREGDSFKVAFEEKFLDGEKISNGNILSAQFTNQGKTFKAVRYEDSHGEVHYYTPDGDTMRKEFLRTPIDFARISSHFNLNRKHPVLNTIRAHKGTDYAASTGTPIKSAGDGKVVYAGKKGGYGNAVVIQHGQTYKTLYAHMSKFGRGIKSGTRVKQGQIIGYVGSTGLATGPHLHYEFYVNGAVRNPVTVKLPKAQAIADSELGRFKQVTAPLIAQLDAFGTAPQVARNEGNNVFASNP